MARYFRTRPYSWRNYANGNYARTISESLWRRLDDFWRTAVRADESGLALICDFTSFAELPKPQLLLWENPVLYR